MIGRQRLLSAALVAGVAVTSALLYTGSEPDLGIPPTAEESTFTESDPSETAPGTIAPAPELDAFSEVVERPLFSRTRRPQTIGDADTGQTYASDKPAKKDQFLVMGIIITGENKVVLLKPTGKSSDVFRVREGERVLEWTVESVTSEAVTIRQGDITDTLKLSDNVLSEAQKRRLAQQRTRTSKNNNRQAAKKKRVRPASKRTPSTKSTAKNRSTSRRIQTPRPVVRNRSNATARRPVR